MSSLTTQLKSSKRIAIVGCPGSGKSTLARILSWQLDLPVLHLDKIMHTKPEFYMEHKEVFRQDVCSELDRLGSWISDGNYSNPKTK